VAAYASASQTLEFASDGLDFTSDPLHMPTANKPIAPGCFRPDLVTPDDFGEGIAWGICMRDPGGPAPYLLRFSLARAEESAPPALKTIVFHGVRATDPSGRLGLRNPERGLRYESQIGNAIGQDNNHMDWIRAMLRSEPDGMTSYLLIFLASHCQTVTLWLLAIGLVARRLGRSAPVFSVKFLVLS